MDKSQRAELLRQRFKAKGGIPFVGPDNWKPIPTPKSRGRVYMPWPEIIPDTKRVPLGWLKPEREKEQSLAVKRIGRVSPLLKIAHHYFTRIPRR